MDQLTLDEAFLDAKPKENIPAEEQRAFEIIRDSLAEMLEQENIPGEAIGITNNRQKDGKPTDYYVIYFYKPSFPICRIRLSKRSKEMRILQKYKDEVAKHTEYKGKTNDNYVTISVASADDFRVFGPLLAFVLDDVLSTMPSEFGCCARYEACSNAEKCLNPTLDLLVRCSYRKKLRKGIIFYGENRVDVSSIVF